MKKIIAAAAFGVLSTPAFAATYTLELSGGFVSSIYNYGYDHNTGNDVSYQSVSTSVFDDPVYLGQEVTATVQFSDDGATADGYISNDYASVNYNNITVSASVDLGGLFGVIPSVDDFYQTANVSGNAYLTGDYYYQSFGLDTTESHASGSTSFGVSASTDGFYDGSTNPLFGGGPELENLENDLSGINFSLSLTNSDYNTGLNTSVSVTFDTVNFVADFGFTGEPADVDYSTPAPIPLPASFPALMAGLGALGFMRRRKRS